MSNTVCYSSLTVVFKDELKMLRAQAYSMDRYWHCTGDIVVVVNDHSDVCKMIDPCWWGKHQHRVKILHHSLWFDKPKLSGWVTQQICKVLGPIECSTQWCIVLDAKNIFVKDFYDGSFINNNLVQTKHQKVLPVFEPSKNIIDGLYNIDLQDIAGPGGIPHWMHVPSCKGIQKTMPELTGQSLVEFWEHNGCLTEFMLHSGYIQYKHGSINVFYGNTQDFDVVQLSHNETHLFETKLASMYNDNILTVCIHRDAWNNTLSSEQKQKFNQFLTSRELISYDHSW